MFQELENFFTLLNEVDNENYQDFSLFEPELKHIHGIHIFDLLSIQPVLREVEGNETKFIAVKCIEIKEAYRSKKVFRQILNILESKNIPIFIDDILNNRLFQFLTNRGYKNIKHQSAYGWKRSMYKLPVIKKPDI